MTWERIKRIFHFVFDYSDISVNSNLTMLNCRSVKRIITCQSIVSNRNLIKLLHVIEYLVMEELSSSCEQQLVKLDEDISFSSSIGSEELTGIASVYDDPSENQQHRGKESISENSKNTHESNWM